MIDLRVPSEQEATEPWAVKRERIQAMNAGERAPSPSDLRRFALKKAQEHEDEAIARTQSLDAIAPHLSRHLRSLPEEAFESADAFRKYSGLEWTEDT